MTATLEEVASLIQVWSDEEKQAVLGIIIAEIFARNGEKLFAVDDVTGRSLAIVEPLRFTVTELILDDNNPGHRELRRRIETPEDSLSIEELLALEGQIDVSV